jgi:hypothetical protein
MSEDAECRRRIKAVAAQAVMTLAVTRKAGVDDWASAYGETYNTELRSEKPGRAGVIIERNADYFSSLDRCAALASMPKVANSPMHWWVRRIQGKWLSVLRLIKAAFTFQGGADYLAWKIERHSGVKVDMTPWQRDHPILASPFIYWKLRRLGAIR